MQLIFQKVYPRHQCTAECVPKGVYILGWGMELYTSNCPFFLIHKEHVPQNIVKGDQTKVGDKLWKNRTINL